MIRTLAPLLDYLLMTIATLYIEQSINKYFIGKMVANEMQICESS